MTGEGTDRKELFKEMYERYGDEMYRSAFRILNNEPDTQDAVQNALIRLYEHLNTVESIIQRGGSAEAYVITLALNTARDLYSKNKASIELYHMVVKDRAVRQKLLEPGSGDSVYERKCAAIVQECLKAVKEEYVNIISLYYYEGYSLKEISEVLGISEQTATVRLWRARKAVEHVLEKSGYDKWIRKNRKESGQ